MEKTNAEIPEVTEDPPANAAPKPRKGKGKKGGQSMAAAEAAASRKAKEPTTRAPQPAAKDAGREQWATVTKRGAKGKGAKRAEGPVRAPRPKKKKKAKPAKIRPPPKTSAVVLTLQPGAAERGVSYAKIMAEAKEKVELTSLGIKGVSMKQAVTGARLIVIPDDANNAKAEAFAQKLRESLPKEDVRVSRPTKQAQIRVTGLDDCTAAAEVLAAVAKAGECSTDELKAGEIRRGRSGLGATWISCPVAVARKVATDGRLLIGWVSAKVKAIAPRQMRCFRCLELGHASAKCPSKVDRSRVCYCCGEEGHHAKQCSAKPHCVVCAAANKPAAHKIWSKACAATSSKKKKAAVAAKKKTMEPSGPSMPPIEAMEA